MLDTSPQDKLYRHSHVLNACEQSCIMMIMGGSKMSKAEYDFTVIMYPAYDTSHIEILDNKVHGANMGPTWVLSATRRAPCWPYEPCYLGICPLGLIGQSLSGLHGVHTMSSTNSIDCN